MRCVDCRWELYPVLGDERSYCIRPGITPTPCIDERENPALCGPEGKHFAPK